MSIPPGLLSELKIADVVTFLAVHRCRSLSSAARELRVTPSQVSKSISRLEELMGATLLSRSPHGVALLDAGLRIVPHFEQMLALTRQLAPGATLERRVLAIAAPSWLAGSLLPHVVETELDFRLRVLELPPAQVRAQLSSGHFDIALTLGPAPAQPSWESSSLGKVTKALFVAPALAERLGPPPIPADRIAGLQFVSPIYLTETGYLPVDDDCPISRRERIVGHETMTFGLALALAVRTDQVVFGPILGALDYLRAGTLAKLEVEGWSLSDDLHLACNIDRVTAAEQKTLASALERALASAAPHA
ncbi:MAG TPA: LysR family transcriptional regulator [Kofleriaceae bacterium]|nr:LysR family transcriptional regulator [Kofleriaceae bacterium]